MGKSKSLVSYLRQMGGTFSTNTKSLDKGEAARKQVYILVSNTVCSELVAKLYKEIIIRRKKKLIPKSTNYFLNQSTFE